MAHRFPTTPIQSFVLIAADTPAVTEAVNELVKDLNGVLQNGSLGADQCTNRQLRAWAADNGAPAYIYTIANDIAANHADIADTLQIQWEHGGSMTGGDDLHVYLTGLLGVVPPIAVIKGYPA